jgi:hypothetical protein
MASSSTTYSARDSDFFKWVRRFAWRNVHFGPVKRAESCRKKRGPARSIGYSRSGQMFSTYFRNIRTCINACALHSAYPCDSFAGLKKSKIVVLLDLGMFVKRNRTAINTNLRKYTYTAPRSLCLAAVSCTRSRAPTIASDRQWIKCPWTGANDNGSIGYTVD